MLLLIWIINALAVILVAYLVPGITIASFWSALIVALVLGLLNAVLRPLLIIFTLPLNILTLGLFTFVINGIILYFVSSIVKGFSVDGLGKAIVGSIVLSLIQWAVNTLMKGPKKITPLA
jgi:putative membrane protein